MITSTKELIEQINIEANYAYRATDKTGGILYQTLNQAAQRLRELDKPDCVWKITYEDGEQYYESPCDNMLQTGGLTSYCSNCGGAVKEST
jgi:hypothetical protein